MAVGAVAVGLPEAKARAGVPFLREITVTYGPDTRPYTLAKIMFDVEPGDLEVTRWGPERLRVYKTADSYKEVPFRYPTASGLMSKFRDSVEHFMARRQPGAEFVTDADKPVRFEFLGDGRPVILPLTGRPTPFESGSFAIHPGVLADKMWASIHVALEQWLIQTQGKRREQAQAPWGPLWMEGHRQALRKIQVTFLIK